MQTKEQQRIYQYKQLTQKDCDDLIMGLCDPTGKVRHRTRREVYELFKGKGYHLGPWQQDPGSNGRYREVHYCVSSGHYERLDRRLCEYMLPAQEVPMATSTKASV